MARQWEEFLLTMKLRDTLGVSSSDAHMTTASNSLLMPMLEQLHRDQDYFTTKKEHTKTKEEVK